MTAEQKSGRWARSELRAPHNSHGTKHPSHAAGSPRPPQRQLCCDLQAYLLLNTPRVTATCQAPGRKVLHGGDAPTPLTGTALFAKPGLKQTPVPQTTRCPPAPITQTEQGCSRTFHTIPTRHPPLGSASREHRARLPGFVGTFAVSPNSRPSQAHGHRDAQSPPAPAGSALCHPRSCPQHRDGLCATKRHQCPHSPSPRRFPNSGAGQAGKRQFPLQNNSHAQRDPEQQKHLLHAPPHTCPTSHIVNTLLPPEEPFQARADNDHQTITKNYTGKCPLGRVHEKSFKGDNNFDKDTPRFYPATDSTDLRENIWPKNRIIEKNLL